MREPSSFQFVVVFLVTTAVAALMIVKGLSARALERRRVRCRACGGVVGHTCTCRRD